MRGVRYLPLLLSLTLALPPGRAARAQQNPVYAQHMLNTYLVNPAVAGYEGVTEFTIYGREQWVTYPERPRTYTMSFQTRVYQDKAFGPSGRSYGGPDGLGGWERFARDIGRSSMGIGAILYNDVNGRMRRTGIQGSYTYMIWGGNVMYSLGLSLSLQQYKANILPEDLYDPLIDDPLVMAGKPNTGLAPDANIGFLVSNKFFYAGLSVSNLLQNALQFGQGNSQSAFRQLRQYHLMGAYRYSSWNEEFALEPSVILVMNERLDWMVDLALKAYYKTNYWAGLAYRTMTSATLMLGLRHKRFLVGYAFEYALGRHQMAARYGSHEFMLGVRVGEHDRYGNIIRKF